VEQGTSGETVGAEAVKDGVFVSGEFCELGIGVQGVSVAGKTVEQGLVWSGLVGDFVVGSAVGWGVAVSGRTAVATPAAFAAHEHGGAGGEEFFFGLFVDKDAFGDGDGAFSFVIDTDALGSEEAFSVDRDWAVQFDSLFSVEKHCHVEASDIRDEAHTDDDRECGEHFLLHVHAVFCGEFEFKARRVYSACSYS